MEHLQLLIRKTQEKEGPQGNIFKFFLIDTLETTFWMKNVTQRWIQSGNFFPKSGHYFWFLQRDKGGLFPSP